MNIRDITPSDVPLVTAIYNHYIESTTISFEEQLVSDDVMLERINHVASLELPWMVAELNGVVVGYAYASTWKPRSAYRFTVEPSIYVEPKATKKGIGKALYRHLLERLQAQGIKNVLGVIALPNEASIALHESMGFKKVGEFANIGYKFDKWLSVGYWQLEWAVDCESL